MSLNSNEIAMQITIAVIQAGPAYRLDSPDKVAALYETIFKKVVETQAEEKESHKLRMP